ncbi:MAG: hypothetical protein ACI83D_000042 [Planctomycetota bacterium]|jgi:hypothetical protein
MIINIHTHKKIIAGSLVALLSLGLFLMPVPIQANTESQDQVATLISFCKILGSNTMSPIYRIVSDRSPVLIQICTLLQKIDKSKLEILANNDDDVVAESENDSSEDEEDDVVAEKETTHARMITSSAESVSVSGSDNDYVEMKITFNTTAFGTDMYIPNVTTNTSFTATSTGTSPLATEGVGYHIQMTGGSATAPTATLSSTASEKTNSFKVEEGTTEEFTITITVPNTSGNLDSESVRALLTGINWATSDSATGEHIHTLSIDDYKTGYAYIAD